MVGRHLAERGVRDLDGEQAAGRRAQPEWNIDVDEALENQTALGLDCAEVDARRFTRDVETPAQIDEAFDAIAYEKGAAVLRMLENYVGAETFRNGVNAYLQAHAYGNATSEDFWKAMAAASGKPVDGSCRPSSTSRACRWSTSSLACAGQPDTR